MATCKLGGTRGGESRIKLCLVAGLHLTTGLTLRGGTSPCMHQLAHVQGPLSKEQDLCVCAQLPLTGGSPSLPHCPDAEGEGLLLACAGQVHAEVPLFSVWLLLTGTSVHAPSWCAQEAVPPLSIRPTPKGGTAT